MPKIGLRNIKTAVSVFICLSIYFLIIILAYAFYKAWDKSVLLATKLYTPFFACIATAYSISTDKSKSISQAKLRCLASLVGGLFGVLIIVIYTKVFGFEWPFRFISAIGKPTQGFTTSDYTTSYILSFIAPVIITALGTVFVIWLCNFIKHSNLSFVAVLTFTAVMVSLGTDPIIYGLNRILSTIIGVLVALAVNLFHLPHYRDNNKLFIISLDGIYVNDNNQINGFNEYKVNNLIYDKANLTYFSTRTPVSLIPMIGHASLNLPVICMSGAALYDIKKKEYLYVENIDVDLSVRLKEIFKEINVTPFVNIIEDNVLYTYNEKLNNKAEEIYANNRKNSAYGCYIKGEAPNYKDICYFMVIETKETIDKIMKLIETKGLNDKLLCLTYDCYEISDNVDTSGYSYLKIYSRRVLDMEALDILNQNNYYTVAAGTHRYDDILLNYCDYKLTNMTATDKVKNIANKVINNTNDEKIFKEIGNIYHTKGDK